MTGLAVRIIARKLPVGVSLGWLLLVVMFPLFGALLYLFVGENRLGPRRAARVAALQAPLERFVGTLKSDVAEDWSTLGPGAEPVQRLVKSVTGYPALGGNDLTLLHDAETILRSIIADVDQARNTCHMEFYIWNEGGTADEVEAALIRAASRGVTCRLLVDAVGSAEFIRGSAIERLKKGGVRVVEALPVGFYHAIFTRLDLRLHRKVVVVDDRVAYTGSLNLVDPRYFKQDEGVGQWVDCMVRLRGPAVQELQTVFLGDWSVEAGEGLEPLLMDGDLYRVERDGPAVVQVSPSGPTVEGEEILKLLLMTVYSARKQLVLTTPYFIPDESLMTALTSAAQRGVEVTIVVPGEVDSFLVRHASRSYFGDLLAAGVRIFCFRDGLLHSKTVTVDGDFSLVGTVNLDMRSFRLNFEVTLFVYGQDFCGQLEALQLAYVSRSAPLESEPWWKRSWAVRLFDDGIRLFSPVL